MAYFGGFFAKLGHFAGFSLHNIDIKRKHPHTVIFRGFFIYRILFAGKISEAAMCGAEVGGQYMYFIASVVERL